MLPPIKVKICDRNKNMLQSYGDKSARVETRDGKILIKKQENILPTDKILTYISNDYIRPIKIAIIDLDIILAFLSGKLARLAFFCQINADGVLIFRFGRFAFKLSFLHKVENGLVNTFGKIHEKILLKSIAKNATSIFWISTKTVSYLFKQNIKATTIINEKYTIPQPIKFNIPQIINTIVYTLYYKTIKDITQGTLKEQFLKSEMTIGDIFTTKKES